MTNILKTGKDFVVKKICFSKHHTETQRDGGEQEEGRGSLVQEIIYTGYKGCQTKY